MSTQRRLNVTLVENEELSLRNEEMLERQKQMESELAIMRLAIRNNPPAQKIDEDGNDDEDEEGDETPVLTMIEKNDKYEKSRRNVESDEDDVVVSSDIGRSTQQADTAMADPLVVTTPERNGQSEPDPSRRAEMSLDKVVVTPRYSLRGQVKARDAISSVAGRG